jgi:AAA domain
MNGNGNGRGRVRFELIDFADIRVDTQRRYLVKNLIPRDGLVVVWGPPKCGKSFFVADLALHIALGWEYRGRRVEQGTVVYIACEGQTGFRNRVEAFRQAQFAEDTPSPPFKLVPTRLDLAQDCDLLTHDIIAQLPTPQCAVIVVDTLNRSLGGSENSDEDMSAYIAACDKLRERFKCTVIVIHHCGIDGTRPRGHTSLMGALDTQIAVKKDENKCVEAKVEYMKDGEDGAILLSRLRQVEIGIDEDGDDITSCVIEIADTFEAKPKAKPGKRLSPCAALVLDSLQKAVNEYGETSPGGSQMPSGIMVAQIEAWRRVHYSKLGTDMKDDAKRQDFYRGRSQLQASHLCAIHEQWAWIIA